MKHLHASTLGLTLTLVAMLLTAPSVAGQWHTSKVTVPNDLVVNQALRRAANALEQEDLDRAIRVWQDALDRLARKVVETHRAPRLGTETDAVLNEDRFGSVRTRVMEALRAATENAATLLRVEDEIGQLAAGYYADVVAVRGDPFSDVTLLESPEFVMKNGDVVVIASQ